MDKETVLSETIFEMDEISKRGHKKEVVLAFLKKIREKDFVPERLSETIERCIEMISVSKMRIIRTRKAEQTLREYLRNLPTVFEEIREAFDTEKSALIADDFFKRCRIV